MKVLRNYLYNASYNILQMILPLVSATYVARTLTKTGVGINSYTNSIIQYFVILGSIGINMYGNRQIAYVRNDPKEKSKVFWEIQILHFIMTAVSLMAFVIYLPFSKFPKVMLIQSFVLLSSGLDISWFYAGIEDFKRTVTRNTLVKVLSLLAILIFIKGKNDLGLYVFILAISGFLGNLTLWPHMKKNLVKISWSKLKPFSHFHASMILFIPQIAVSMYAILNKNLLGSLTGPVNSGYYNYADTLIKTVLSLATSLGTVMLPHAANAFANGQKQKVKSYLYRSFDIISLLSFAMMFGLAAVSLHLGPYIFGKGFGPVGTAMLLETPILVLIGWSNAVGTQYLLPTNQNRFYNVSVILGAVVNLIIILPFVYFWKLSGAMIATDISELVVTVYQLWVIRNQVDFKKLFVNTPKYFIAGIIMFVPVFKMNISVKTSVLALFLEVILGIVLYLLCLLIFKPSGLNDLKNLIKNRNK